MAERDVMIVDGYTLANPEKVDRVIDGVVTREGRTSGGLGSEADPELIRAHYDKIGGLILKGDKTIKTGSFWDFEKRAPREKPDVVFVHRSKGGELFEYRGEESEPIEVKAEKEIAKKAVTLAGKKKGKKLE